MNKQGRNRIAQSFEKLGFPIFLLDSEGHCLLPEGERMIVGLPSACAVSSSFHYDGYVIRKVNVQPVLFLAMDADMPGVENLLCMAEQMVALLLQDDAGEYGPIAFYRQLLCREISADEVESAIVAGNAVSELSRCVVVFQAAQTMKENLYAFLNETLPLQSTDVLVELDARHTALIKDVSGMEEKEELSEYVLAADETLQQESGLRVSIGIGGQRNAVAALRDSYTEARKALEIGAVFHPDQHIFFYDKLIMERFLSAVSREESLRFQSLLFNRHTQRIFNEEMLQTIEMFFEKDLNLSDTARQLYIHRNTLVYRLEKVQRATGLDLRHFKDAVTFKMLYELKRSTTDKGSKL